MYIQTTYMRMSIHMYTIVNIYTYSHEYTHACSFFTYIHIYVCLYTYIRTYTHEYAYEINVWTRLSGFGTTACVSVRMWCPPRTLFLTCWTVAFCDDHGEYLLVDSHPLRGTEIFTYHQDLSNAHCIYAFLHANVNKLRTERVEQQRRQQKQINNK